MLFLYLSERRPPSKRKPCQPFCHAHCQLPIAFIRMFLMSNEHTCHGHDPNDIAHGHHDHQLVPNEHHGGQDVAGDCLSARWHIISHIKEAWFIFDDASL